MLMLLHGADTFRSRRFLRKTIEEFRNRRDPSGMNVAVFDAEKAEPSLILEALVASPFLSEKRLTVVENLSASRQVRILGEEITSLIKSKKTPESTMGVFWEGELKKNSAPVFTVLAKQEYSQKFDPLTGKKLAGWIEAEIKKRGLLAEKPALAALLNYPWRDLWQADNELNKMEACLSAKEEKILTAKDLKFFLGETADDNVFHFIDALLGRQAKTAINLLADQWQSGESEGKIFNLLVGQWRNLLIIKDFLNLNPGANSYLAAQSLNLNPFVVKKSLAILPAFSFEKLKEVYGEFLEMDIRAKTGAGDLKKMLEILVAKICR